MASFEWIGAYIKDLNNDGVPDGTTADWVNSENWKKDGMTGTGSIPGDKDDVSFGSAAPSDKRKPNMETAYMVKSITINSVASGNEYQLSLAGKLTVLGPTDSAIAAGTVGAGAAGGEIVFAPPAAVDSPTFTWRGGTLDVPVTVSDRTKLRIAAGSTPKLLKQKMLVNSLDAAWDGVAASEGTSMFWVEGTNAELAVGSGARFTIDATDAGADAYLQLNASAKFTNRGTVTVKMASDKKLDLSTPGKAENYGRFELTQGSVLSRNYLNAGTTDLTSGTVFAVGYLDPATGKPDPTVAASLVLDPTSTATSAFVGAGKLYLHPNSSVSLPAGTASVANVDDYSSGTSGQGNLIIKGTYMWGRPDKNKREAAPWAGPGTTQVGTDTERSAKLVLGGLIHGTQRPLVNYGRIEWKSSTISPTIPDPLPTEPGGGTFDWKSLTFSTVGLENKGRVGPASTDYPTFEVDAASGFRMSMTGDVKNAGIVQVTADPVTVDGQEVFGVDFGGKCTNVSEGKLDVQRRTGKGKVKIDGKTYISMGSVNVGGNVQLVLAGGLDQDGGDLVAGGARLDVIGTYNFAGGTADFSGTLDGVSLLADNVEQTGGTLTAYNALLDITGSYAQLAGTVELELSGAIVGSGWNVGQFAALYSFRSNTITGDLSNNGLVELGPMTSPPDQPWRDTLGVTNFTQNSSGVLRMDVSSSYTDAVSVSDHATLGGTLHVRAPASFSGLPGQFIDLVTYQTRTGEFATYILPSGWSPEYQDNLPNGPGVFRIRRGYF